MKKTEILFLLADGFEQSEYVVPKRVFDKAKIHSVVAAPPSEKLRGWQDNNWGDGIKRDLGLNKVQIENYQSLVLPGGLISIPTLRTDDAAIELVREFHQRGKLVAAIGHAVGLLISADVLKTHKATAYRSLRSDVVNSGAIWFESHVVKDKNLITAQSSEFAEAFAKAIVTDLQKALQVA